MATERLTLTITQKTDTATQRIVTATLKYYGNGVSWSNYDCPATITFNGVKKSWSSTIHPSESTTAQTVVSQDFTVNKTHATQSLTGSATFTVTGTSLGTLTTTSSAYSITPKTSYTVSYAANGGSGTTTSQKKWYNQSLTLLGALTKSGYSFSKWQATDKKVYNAGGAYTTNAATTMTAQWTANTYYVKFNANGGSGSMANETFTYGTAKKLTKNTFTRTGYTFNGWKTAATSGTSYTNEESVLNLTSTANATINLYAQWSPNTYTITLDDQSADTVGTTIFYEKYNTGIYSNSTATTSITSITCPVKSGYKFGGYYTTTDEEGVQYIDSSGQITATNTTFIKNTTLYALWIQSYVPPKITNVKLVRCTENGTETLSGDYAKLSFNWTAGITENGTVNTNTNLNIRAVINDDSEIGSHIIEYEETGLTDQNGLIENNILSSQILYFNPGSVTITILDVIANQSFSTTAYIPEGGFPIHISQKENNITLFGACSDEQQGLIVNAEMQVQGKTVFNNKNNEMRLAMIPNVQQSAIWFLASSQQNQENFPMLRMLYSSAGNFGLCGAYLNGDNNWMLRMDQDKNLFMSGDKIVLGTSASTTTKDIQMIHASRQMNISLNANNNFGFYDATIGWVFSVDANGRLSAPRSIVHGSVNITTTAANTPTKVHVPATGSWPFAGVPTIFVTPYTGVPGTGVTGCSFTNPTKEGCDIVITRTGSGTTTVHYLAFY